MSFDVALPVVFVGLQLQVVVYSECVCMCVCMCVPARALCVISIYLSIYLERERGRERDRDKERERERERVCVCVKKGVCLSNVNRWILLIRAGPSVCVCVCVRGVRCDWIFRMRGRRIMKKKRNEVKGKKKWKQMSKKRKQVRGRSSNLLSFLFRCRTRPNEWGTQWDSNSLVKVC